MYNNVNYLHGGTPFLLRVEGTSTKYSNSMIRFSLLVAAIPKCGGISETECQNSGIPFFSLLYLFYIFGRESITKLYQYTKL